MHNVYYYMLAIVAILQCYVDSMVAIKINSTFSMINEELITYVVTEQSKLEANQANDISLLSINQDKLKNIIEKLLTDNIEFLSPKAMYYFYDSKTLSSCPIGYNYCNSVQIKITFDYKNKIYEKVFRYEPVEA